MRLRNEKHFNQNLLVLLGAALVTLIFILIFTNLSAFKNAFSGLFSVLSSLLYGIVFAYLLNPLVNVVDRRLLPRLLRRNMRDRTARRLSRVLGMVFAFAVGIFVVYALVSMIAPQLYTSIRGLIVAMPDYYNNLEAWVQNVLEDNPDFRQVVEVVLERAYEYLNDFVNVQLIDNLQVIMKTLTSSVFAVFREVINMVIGIIVAVYILLSKDIFLAQTKKLAVAFFHPETANRIMENGRRINRIFNGFIIGKILDSMIIGILAYIGLAILRMPYAVLLAAIIGVTNVIPYFGPIIGAVPCALLVLLVSPIKCFYFIIFVLVLQQVDGNVIGPRILGENVGISGFWILISITVGSGLFGFGGMLLGVPVFAIIYMLFSDTVSRALVRKGRSTVTDDYYKIRSVEDLSEKPPDEGDDPAQITFDLHGADSNREGKPEP